MMSEEIDKAFEELDKKLFDLAEEFKDRLNAPAFCASLWMIGLRIARQTALKKENVQLLWDDCFKQFNRMYKGNK